MKPKPNLLSPIEVQLRRAPPAVVPPDLHDSIVSAVRSARAESAHPPTVRWQPWMALTLVLTLTSAALWWAVRPRSADPSALPDVGLVGELREAAHQSVANLPNPLATELESLARDVNGAVSFVAARVPVGL